MVKPRNRSRARPGDPNKDEDTKGHTYTHPDPDRHPHWHPDRHAYLDDVSDVLTKSQLSKGSRLTASWSMTKV